MPRRIKIPSTSNIKTFSASSVIGRQTEDFGILHSKPHDRNQVEDQILADMEMKTKLLGILDDFATTWSKVKDSKNPSLAFGESSMIAVKVLFTLLLSGKERTRMEAAKHILDRAIGKPIERQMTANLDLNSMQPEEVDREILRLLRTIKPGDILGTDQSDGSGREADVGNGTSGERAATG